MVSGKIVEIISPTAEETERIGSLVGEMLTGGDILALVGELGAGKTTFVRGIAERMGCDKGEVASPSFTVINEYNGSPPLFHIDFYRLEGEKDLCEIGYEEYIQGNGVVVIEWADKLPQAVPKESLWIILRYLDAEHREIILRAQGERYEKMIEGLKRRLYK